MLQIRPNCECCDRDLPVDSADARICAYECTVCASCVETVLLNVCPNCGGGFVPRPIRPAIARRDGVSRIHQPPSEKRIHSPSTREQLHEFARRFRAIAPEER